MTLSGPITANMWGLFPVIRGGYNMTRSGSFFRSKVAQRIFFLFILCALLPVFVLSVLSYTQVSSQLKRQSLDRLQNSAKAHGMSIYERFLFFETNLKLIVSGNLNSESNQLDIHRAMAVNQNIFQQFKAVGVITASGQLTLLHNEFKNVPGAMINKALTPGPYKPSHFFTPALENTAPGRVFMMIKLNPGATNSETLVGEIKSTVLWGIGYENILPPMTDLCVIDQFRNIMVTSFPADRNLLHRITLKIDGAAPRSFGYKQDQTSYFVSYWPMFLRSRFDAPGLTIILRTRTSNALAPLSNFKKIFPLVILLSVLIVLLLSIVHIRKNLLPLERLKEGTLRVAKQDFKTRVIVSSNDEFEDLADSFNSMSTQLDREFDALTTRTDIDRAILSSLSTKKIINTALKRMFVFFSCQSISINLVVEKQPDTVHAYITTNIKIRKTREEFFRITAEDMQTLSNSPRQILVDSTAGACSFLSKTDQQTKHSFLVLPLFFDNMLKGMVALGHLKDSPFSDNDLRHARQIADQVMVALSNSSLVEALEKLNIGTVQALARAVDTKSAWTAGHSERVTELSLKIATVMGFTPGELEVLQRAALLHDIGKIGVPISILDKPGRLTDEEFEKVKEHPLIGMKILEPIPAYVDVLPVVSQHHERYNGQGYPYGLAGQEIVIGARILAVADVYDAVVSDRPYRNGWIEEKAIRMITDEAGKHFDPLVVKAFLAAI